jgi:hypothetical protein
VGRICERARSCQAAFLEHKPITATPVLGRSKSPPQTPPLPPLPATPGRSAQVGPELTWQEVVFSTVGGLRGALALILAQTVLTSHHETELEPHLKVGARPLLKLRARGRSPAPCHAAAARRQAGAVRRAEHQRNPAGRPARHAPPVTPQHVRAQMVLWTAGVVLVSLVVYAPLLIPLMRALALNKATPAKKLMHK